MTRLAGDVALPLAALLTLGLLAGCIPAVDDVQFPSVPSAGTWGSVTANQLPAPRQSGSAAASGGMLQFMGGSNGGAFPLANTWVLDPSTGLWTAGQPLQTIVGGAASAVDPSGNILTLGGYDGTVDSTAIQQCSVVSSCVTGTGAWTTAGPTLTTGRQRFSAVRVGSLIYLIGGCTGGCPFATMLNLTEALDPVALTTNGALAQMPTAREDAVAQEVNGIIYVIGGGTGSTVLTTVEAYDTTTDTWTTKAPLPSAREFPASGVLNGNIYVIGGGDINGNTVNTVFIYSPALDQWFTGTPSPHASNRTASATLNGAIYVIGGDMDFGNTPQTWVDVLTP